MRLIRVQHCSNRIDHRIRQRLRVEKRLKWDVTSVFLSYDHATTQSLLIMSISYPLELTAVLTNLNAREDSNKYLISTNAPLNRSLLHIISVVHHLDVISISEDFVIEFSRRPPRMRIVVRRAEKGKTSARLKIIIYQGINILFNFISN